jgi:hypothetical protein
MAIYKMEWKKRYMDSGWVGEIQGFKANGDFSIPKGSYLVPIEGKTQACKNRLATFELLEGKVYMIDKTGKKNYCFAVVLNEKIHIISGDEVEELLIQKGHQPPNTYKKKSTTPNRSQQTFSNKIKAKLSDEVDFIIRSLEEAFTAYREKKAIEVLETMSAAVMKYAQLKGYTNECVRIYQAFSQGKSSEEIRTSLY